MHEEVEFCIADLIPSELSVIGPGVEKKRRAFHAAEPMVAAVVRVDGGLLVVDGHHTIRAMFDEGHQTIKCRVRHETDPEQIQRRREVYLRRRQEGLTFESLPVDASESERAQRTEAEMDGD